MTKDYRTDERSELDFAEMLLKRVVPHVRRLEKDSRLLILHIFCVWAAAVEQKSEVLKPHQISLKASRIFQRVIRCLPKATRRFFPNQIHISDKECESILIPFVEMGGTQKFTSAVMSALLESFLDQQKRRKHLGAFYTPTAVCDFLISKLNFSFVPGQLPRAFDPTCGTGQFLVAYVQHLIRNGHSSPELARVVSGNDIEPVALFISAYRLLNVLPKGRKSVRLDLFCVDFTSAKEAARLHKWLGRIDHVVGNPPYGGDSNSNGSYTNTWQSCLSHIFKLPMPLSAALVLPASFANSTGAPAALLRKTLIDSASRIQLVAFDTRPCSLFPHNDQRPLLLVYDIDGSNRRELLSGGFRRHRMDRSIEQSLSDISWYRLNEKSVGDIIPLPSSHDDVKLLRLASKPSAARRNLSDDVMVSVLVYGRYNLNALLGPPPVGGGNRWRTFSFDRETAARVVVALNSNVGWSLFRSLTNGLDFNNRVIERLLAIPVREIDCERLAMHFSDRMRASYKTHHEYSLSGRFEEFTNLNKQAGKIFDLKSHHIDVLSCADGERMRLLKQSR